jgi:hypothetical protein
MNTPAVPPSKLYIRSEILAVIDYLATVEHAAKQEKTKQLKRLQGFEDQAAVINLLIKELQRAKPGKTLQVIGELLMELGTIDQLRDPLWALIRLEGVSDEIKDTANLVLRHLGDETDPDLYLDYLDDPVGLINRETERMLQVSAANPEALIDFIDFIFSLPEDEQMNLIQSLQDDYDPDYLLNIYMPILDANPPEPTAKVLIRYLGNSKTMRSAVFLDGLAERFADNDELLKLIRRALNELKLAGVAPDDRAEQLAAYNAAHPHVVVRETELYKCYATIPDGIGNQGMMITRKKPNGDVIMMSVAINDLHGLIDCFGFYDLTENDYLKILEKFHEESNKIQVPAAYAGWKLRQAEAISRKARSRVPYEYSCWRVIMDDLESQPMDLVATVLEWAKPRWQSETSNLYQHPDFQTWFLEEEDHEIAARLLSEILVYNQQLMRQAEENPAAMISQDAFTRAMDQYAGRMTMELLASDWRDVLVQRLAEAAYLLNLQQTHTFATLAATEMTNLLAWTPEIEPGGHTFIRQYGRRCIEELLLRVKFVPHTPSSLIPLVDAVLNAWKI